MKIIFNKLGEVGMMVIRPKPALLPFQLSLSLHIYIIVYCILYFKEISYSTCYHIYTFFHSYKWLFILDYFTTILFIYLFIYYLQEQNENQELLHYSSNNLP